MEKQLNTELEQDYSDPLVGLYETVKQPAKKKDTDDLIKQLTDQLNMQQKLINIQAKKINTLISNTEKLNSQVRTLKSNLSNINSQIASLVRRK